MYGRGKIGHIKSEKFISRNGRSSNQHTTYNSCANTQKRKKLSQKLQTVEPKNDAICFPYCKDILSFNLLTFEFSHQYLNVCVLLFTVHERILNNTQCCTYCTIKHIGTTCVHTCGKDPSKM